MGVIVFLLVFIVLFVILEKLLINLFGIEKKKLSESPGKTINRRGRNIILVIFLVALPFVNFEEYSFIKWYFILFNVLLFGFQSFMEWIYVRESKQYVTSLFFLIIIVAFIYNAEFIVKVLN
ncbi:hypothetical protein HNQ94_001025 [Salirhabdus euzebyi]|uniref:DUF4181 domain-containing protein n=1 Tax=Salirhabdus euzebyi TaxID=394506 RepID=A0A841PUU8_9BACI|nr:DUF4181 domain-containing protein [Salirhabdus euzebyi]MBB6452580.1 hypothetical protein [Salirhabdus euzebyi]